MSDQNSHFDVIVAGAGIGGVSAAIAAARTGARVLLIEKLATVGGTGVHSPVILICTYRDKSGRPITTGLHREFFPWIYEEHRDSYAGSIDTYDEKYLGRKYNELIEREPTLAVWTGTEVAEVERDGGRITRLRLVGDHAGWVAGDVFIDSTAEGNLSALAGAQFQLGRPEDGSLQPATLTFKVTGADWRKFKTNKPFTSFKTWDEWVPVQNELEPLFQALRASGKTSNARNSVLFFAYPDDQSLLFNQTRVLGVNSTDAASVEAGKREGEKQVHEFWDAIRVHPAFEHARIEFISQKLGVREGRRIVGDYVITREDVLAEARFDDMVAACAGGIDIHSPTGGGGQFIHVPGTTGYYHIPYRSLMAKGFSNLLLGSRCISGSHEAHGSYRIMVTISAIGEAVGAAAGLAARYDCDDVREISAAQIRTVLKAAGQFVEGACEALPTRVPQGELA